MGCSCPIHVSHLASCKPSCVCAGEPERVERRSDGGRVSAPPREIKAKDSSGRKRVDRMG